MKESVYIIGYKLKKGNSTKTVAFAKTINEAFTSFMRDWLDNYNKAVSDGAGELYSNPDELEWISIEPVCPASEVVGR
jgi:hypothetical protein